MNRAKKILRIFIVLVYFGWIFKLSVNFSNDFFDTFLIRCNSIIINVLNSLGLSTTTKQFILVFYGNLRYSIYFLIITMIFYTFYKETKTSILHILILMYVIFRVIWITVIYRLCGYFNEISYEVLESLFLEIPVTTLFILLGKRLGTYISNKVMSN